MFLTVISNQYFKTFFIILALFVVKIVADHLMKKAINMNKSIGKIYLKHTIDYLLYFLIIYTILCSFQATAHFVSVVLASSGLIVAVLGFAAQQSLSNVISGFMIILFHPFEVNDRITLKSKGITGSVKSISLRHTVICTHNNTYITIPNSVMNNEIIENYDVKTTESNGFLDLSVSYESDVRKAISLVQQVVYEHPLTIKCSSPTEVKVQVRNLADSGIELRANIWTNTINDNFQACSDLRIAVLEVFRQNDIEIPYPHVQISSIK